jgi:hypothetical protein
VVTSVAACAMRSADPTEVPPNFMTMSICADRLSIDRARGRIRRVQRNAGRVLFFGPAVYRSSVQTFEKSSDQAGLPSAESRVHRVSRAS